MAAGRYIVGTLVAALELEDKLSRPVQVANQSIDVLDANVLRLNNSVVGLGSTFTQVGGSVSRFGDRLTLLTAPITAATVASAKLASNFERDMTKLVTLAGISTTEMHQMRDAVLSLGPATGQGPDELAKGLYAITSVGTRGAEALDILKVSALGASMGMGETEEISRALVAAMKAYGPSGLTAAHAMDALHMAITEGGAEASGFADTLGRVISTAKLAGVSFEELVGSVATFTRLGVKADEAVTALRGTLSVLLKPSQGARQELLMLGTSIEQLRDKVRKDGLADALIDLVKLTKGNDDAIAHIVPNVRALAGVLANADSQADAYRQIVMLATNATGNFDQAVSKMTETNDFKMKSFWSQIQVLGIEFGDHLLPVINKFIAVSQPLINVADSIITSFSNWPPILQTTTMLLGGFVLILGPILSIGGRVLQLVGMLALGYQALSTWISGTAAAQAAEAAAVAAATAAYTAEAIAIAAAAESRAASTAAAAASAAAALSSAAAEAVATASTTTAAGAYESLAVSSTSSAAGLWSVSIAAPAAAAGAAELGTATVAAGAGLAEVAATAPIAAAGVGTLTAVLTGGGLVALFAALTYGFYKLGEAIVNAKHAWDEGKLWDFLTAKDTDNWVRRWLGMGDAAVEGGNKIKSGFDVASAASVSLQTLQDRMQGLDLKNQVNELGLVFGRLKESGNLVPDALSRISAEATRLKAAGAELPEFLDRLAQKEEQVTLGSLAAARGLQPFTDKLNEVKSSLISFSAEVNAELRKGAANFGMDEFIKTAMLMPEAAKVGEAALKEFYTEYKKAQQEVASANQETTNLIAEAAVLRVAHSSTTTDAQIKDIERWGIKLTERMKKAHADSQEFYDALATLSKEKVREIEADWDWLRNNSLEAAYDRLKRAYKTMQEMMTSGLVYGRDQWDRMRQVIQDAEDNVRNYGKTGTNSLTSVGNAASVAKTEMQMLADATLAAKQRAIEFALEQERIKKGFYTLDINGVATAATSMTDTLVGHSSTLWGPESRDPNALTKMIAELTRKLAEWNGPPPMNFQGQTIDTAYRIYRQRLDAIQAHLDQEAQLEYLKKLLDVTEMETRLKNSTSSTPPPQIVTNSGDFLAPADSGVVVSSGASRGLQVINNFYGVTVDEAVRKINDSIMRTVSLSRQLPSLR